ncbi:hypothetical protein COK10_10670 [Bacillus anthracis]|nr:hypothetical protein COK10_10670 [Bacillus anthracis]
MERESMNLQIANQEEIKGQWVICEMEDGPQITKVEKAVNNNVHNKMALWGFWQSESSIKGEWGFNNIDQCRLATLEEIDMESWREVFRRKGRVPGKFITGDWVTDDVNALTVLYQDDDIVTVGVVNTTKTYQVAAEDLEPLFFKEDMAG